MECHQKHAARDTVHHYTSAWVRINKACAFLPLDSPKGKNGSVQSHTASNTLLCRERRCDHAARQAVRVAWSILPLKSANPEDIEENRKEKRKRKKRNAIVGLHEGSKVCQPRFQAANGNTLELVGWCAAGHVRQKLEPRAFSQLPQFPAAWCFFKIR